MRRLLAPVASSRPMSLATRCSNCGTVFRVVQDQLLVSEGWVRCGRCREVFNAIENMFDLNQAPASESMPASVRTAPPNEAEPRPSAHRTRTPAHDDGPESLIPDDSISTPAATSRSFTHSRPSHVGRDPWGGATTEEVVRTSLWPESQRPETPADAAGGRGVRRDAAADADDDSVDGAERAGLPSEAQVDNLLVSNARDTTFAPYEEPPGFIVRAEKESQWRSPRVRFALRVAAWVLGVTLLMQVAMQHRDALAARWPVTEGALQSLCVPLGCKVEAPRKLQALKVEHASFTESGTAGLYRLQVSLRNVDSTRVRMPALDLRLTTPRGETLSRRVVMASELGYNLPSLEGGQDVTLQGTLRVLQLNVNGFDVTVFYP